MKEVIIDSNNENQRIDKFLLKYFGNMPKSFLHKMLRKKNIKLNGGKIEGNEIIKKDDSIKIFLSDETIDNFSLNKEEKVKENLKVIKKSDLSVIFEDESMLIVYKPANMLVYEDSKEKDNTLINEIINYLEYTKCPTYFESKKMNFMPAICNRLDRNTEGLVIAAKNFVTTKKINELIKEKKVTKKYLTLVKGNVKEDRGVIKLYWTKDKVNNEASVTPNFKEGASEIITEYNVIKRGAKTTLVEINLITGKSHQIRVSMAHIGNPIVGDIKYGDKVVNREFRDKFGIKSQLLCAYKLELLGKNYEVNCDYEKYLV